MTERLRKISEKVGYYKPIAGDDSESTQGEIPLEVIERMRKKTMEGQAAMIDATETVDENGSRVIEVREKYYELKRLEL